jgi:hypothetical protein
MRNLLFFILLISNTYAYAGWVLVQTSYDDNVIFYVDPDTIQRKGNTLRVWEKLEYKKPENYLNFTFQSARALVEYDCKEKKSRLLSQDYFSQPELKGKSVYNLNTPNAEWTFIPPQTTGAYSMNSLCNKR